MKWKKNQFEGRKVLRQPTVLAHWTQKVGGTIPNKLRRQYYYHTML